MLRRIFFILFVCIAVGGTVFAYFYLRSAKKPKRDITSLIPANCSYVVECDNFMSFNKKLRENSLIWEELIQDPFFSDLNSTITNLDSLIKLNDAAVKLFTDNRIYFSGFETTNGIENIIALNLNEPEQEEGVVDFLKTHCLNFENIKLDNGEFVHKANTRKTNTPYFFYCSSGVLIISKQQSLIEKILSPDNKPLNTDKHFLELEEDGGNNMDARIYLRNLFYSKLLNENSIKSFEIRAGNEWTALDFNSSPNEIRLNGFIDADSSRFLQALKTQDPVEVKFIHYTPSNASSFSFLGISDYQSFSSGMLHKKNPEVTNSIDYFSGRTEAGLVNEWSVFFNGEFAVVNTQLSGTAHTLGLTSVNDNELAAKFFKQISDTIISLQLGVDSVFYCKNSSLFSTLTCNLFSEKFSFYYVSKEYVLFAESDSIIKKYLNELSSSGNLAKTERFETSMRTNLNDHCNYYHFQDLSKSYGLVKSYLSESVLSTFKSSEERFKKFGFMGVQLSSHKGKILTQSSLQYNPVTKDQTLTLWETQLDTVSNNAPQVLVNHKTGGKELFVADEAGHIYLISNTGKIQWKKNLGEKPMSPVYQVDFFKNGKLQMLFNSANYIHLIDRNGNYVTGYPIKLESQATNPLAVYDYENTKDYRILLACENRKIYNYTINGKITEGFNFPQTNDVVNLKIDFRRINAKDYLIAIDKSGNIYGTGRKGEARLAFTNKLPGDLKTYFFDEGKDISRSKIYFTDLNEPALKTLSLSDKQNSISLNSDIKITGVSYTYVNEDRLIDCIISDESGFEVLDDAGNKLVSYLSKTDCKPDIKSLIINDQVYFLLVDKIGEMHLIDISGKRVETKGVYFSTLPVVTDINTDAKLYMIGVMNDKVNCYRFNE
ncbi:MAG: hypothetical protein Q8M29_09175 [Bacteroidota bacterium]|nr:hypothetical protein [Bacteroidota bacterium]